MTLSNYPPGVTGNEPQIAGQLHYPGPLPLAIAVDAVKLPDMRKLADELMDRYGDTVEQFAMDLAGEVEGFDTDMINYDDYIDGPHQRMIDRLWTELFSHLISPTEG